MQEYSRNRNLPNGQIGLVHLVEFPVATKITDRYFLQNGVFCFKMDFLSKSILILRQKSPINFFDKNHRQKTPVIFVATRITEINEQGQRIIR